MVSLEVSIIFLYLVAMSRSDDATPPSGEVRRRAVGEAGAKLRREAAVLAYARHPGVITMCGYEDDGDEVTVTTEAMSGPRLTEIRLTAQELAGVAAVLATTLADLHEIGIAHGAVTPDAVRLGPDGQPVLEDFAQAKKLTGPFTGWPTTEEAMADERSLGALVSMMLSRAPSEVRSLPGIDHGHLGPAAKRPQRSVHATLARVVAAAVEGRVTARQFAEIIVASIPSARLPTAPEPGGQEPPVQSVENAGVDDPPGSKSAGRSQRAVAPAGLPSVANRTVRAVTQRWFRLDPRSKAATIAVPVLIVTTWLIIPVHRTDRRRASSPPSVMTHRPLPRNDARSPSRPVAEPVTADPPAVTPAALGQPAVGAPTAETTRSPLVCLPAEASAAPPCGIMSYADGTLEIGRHRYTVGHRGDLLAVGRWSCGPELVAVLRPASKQLWVFTSWPGPGASTPPKIIATVADATGIQALGAASCDAMVVTRSTGPPVEFGPWQEGSL